MNTVQKIDNLITEIHNAYLRRHLDTTVKTIKNLEESSYKRIFGESIHHLKSLAEELRFLRGFTQELPNILNALTELNRTHAKNEMVINALVALLILFGEKPKAVQVQNIYVYFTK